MNEHIYVNERAILCGCTSITMHSFNFLAIILQCDRNCNIFRHNHQQNGYGIIFQ